MASEVKTNKISPSTSTTVTLGDASDLFQLPASAEIDIASGATLDVNGTIDVTGATTTGFPSSGFDDLEAFTSTQAYTIPAGITKQLFYVTGSGGGGGGASGSYNATSGGSGGTVIKKLALAAGSVIQITVGAAGTAGAGSGDGGAGGNVTVASTSGTSFTTLTGPGGTAGKYNAQNGAPTAVSGGDINLQGGGGGHNSAGAASYWGGGGSGSWSNAAGLAGVAPGSGGASGTAEGATGYPGGAGAPGIVAIHLYK